jgi:hypothetical protein
MVVAIMVLDLSVTQFMGGLLSAVTLSDALLGVFKGTVFGLLIGLSGCMKGMQTGGDASCGGEGRHLRRGPGHHPDHRGERRHRLARRGAERMMGAPRVEERSTDAAAATGNGAHPIEVRGSR